MIFVTVGTNEAPFDRLLRAVWTLGESEELVVQHGSSTLRPPGAACVDFLPYPALVELVSAARVIVAHAGVGSVLLAVRSGKRPFVMPRRSRLGEAIDDHQVAFANRLHAAGMVEILESPVRVAIFQRESHAPNEQTAGASLCRDLRECLARTLGPA